MGVADYNEALIQLLNDGRRKHLVIQRFAYDADGNLEYEGWAMAGTSAATAGWRILKRTWTSGELTLKAWCRGLVAWDNRAASSTTYE